MSDKIYWSNGVSLADISFANRQTFSNQRNKKCSSQHICFLLIKMQLTASLFSSFSSLWHRNISTGVLMGTDSISCAVPHNNVLIASHKKQGLSVLGCFSNKKSDGLNGEGLFMLVSEGVWNCFDIFSVGGEKMLVPVICTIQESASVESVSSDMSALLLKSTQHLKLLLKEAKSKTPQAWMWDCLSDLPIDGVVEDIELQLQLIELSGLVSKMLF